MVGSVSSISATLWSYAGHVLLFDLANCTPTKVALAYRAAQPEVGGPVLRDGDDSLPNGSSAFQLSSFGEVTLLSCGRCQDIVYGQVHIKQTQNEVLLRGVQVSYIQRSALHQQQSTMHTSMAPAVVPGALLAAARCAAALHMRYCYTVPAAPLAAAV